MKQDDIVFVWLERQTRGETEWLVIRGVFPHYPPVLPSSGVERTVLQMPFDRMTDLLACPTGAQAERETGA